MFTVRKIAQGGAFPDDAGLPPHGEGSTTLIILLIMTGAAHCSVGVRRRMINASDVDNIVFTDA